MKTTKFYGIISFLLIAITIISCVEDGEFDVPNITVEEPNICLLYTSPSPRDKRQSRMPSSA